LNGDYDFCGRLKIRKITLGTIFMDTEATLEDRQKTNEKTPEFKLFSANALGVAAFVGTPLCAVLLAFINHRRLGQTAKARMVMGVGVTLSTLLLALFFALPDEGVPWSSINLGVAFGVKAWANQHFNEDFQRHKEAGGIVGLTWWAVLFGILALGVVLGVAFAIMMAYYTLTAAPCIQYKSGGEEVCYHAPIPIEDAQCVMTHLAHLNYFSGSDEWTFSLREVQEEKEDVLLRKTTLNKVVVSAFTGPAGWDKSLHREWDDLRGSLENACFANRALEFHVLEELGKVKVAFPNLRTPPCVESDTLEAKERVCYRPPVTRTEAKCVTEKLVEAEWFNGSGDLQLELILPRRESITQLQVPVFAESLNDDAIYEFEALQAEVQKSCFGETQMNLLLMNEEGKVSLTLPRSIE
jgi:hypothetical protein